MLGGGKEGRTDFSRTGAESSHSACCSCYTRARRARRDSCINFRLVLPKLVPLITLGNRAFEVLPTLRSCGIVLGLHGARAVFWVVDLFNLAKNMSDNLHSAAAVSLLFLKRDCTPGDERVLISLFAM